MNRHINK